MDRRLPRVQEGEMLKNFTGWLHWVFTGHRRRKEDMLAIAELIAKQESRIDNLRDGLAQILRDTDKYKQLQTEIRDAELKDFLAEIDTIKTDLAAISRRVITLETKPQPIAEPKKDDDEAPRGWQGKRNKIEKMEGVRR